MSNEMKALAKTHAGPGLDLIRAPVPEIGPDDVLIKIHKTGICGTDIHIWDWDEWAAKTVPVPMITPISSPSNSAAKRWTQRT